MNFTDFLIFYSSSKIVPSTHYDVNFADNQNNDILNKNNVAIPSVAVNFLYIKSFSRQHQFPGLWSVENLKQN